MNMANETRNKLAVGALQLAVTLALTALGLYLLLAGKLSASWMAMSLMTSGIFGLAAYQTRDKWQDWRYWATLSACLVVHCALVAAVRVYLASIPLAIVGFFGAFECAAMVWALLMVCK
jgi:hypothetical protein